VEAGSLARGIDDERVRDVLDHQRMIARGGEGTGQAGENAGSVMIDGAGLAVHQSAAGHAAAEVLAYRLMAEADAKQRPLRFGTSGDEIKADAGLVGRARARRDQKALGAA